ncbi:MAG: carbohydrate kinase family protein [Candidatus Faecivicinus sp.]
MAYVAVVGAANVDIGGFPSGRAVAGDSNPGRVRLSMGGVGRNIACNAARLGLQAELITALGGDLYADMICADCARAGVGLTHALSFPGESTSTYLFIADAGGDMSWAVNDMAIHDRMTVAQLEPLMPALRGAALVVLDANLPEETLAHLARSVDAPVIADCVSAAKAGRLRGALPCLDAIKPNRIEAGLLTGIDVVDEASARRAAEKLLELGAKRVFLTLGAQGVCCADGHGMLRLSGVPVQMKNATGAGDAFTAALAWAKLKELTLEETALAGMAAAAIAVESLETVSTEMSEALLERRMHEIKQELRRL